MEYFNYLILAFCLQLGLPSLLLYAQETEGAEQEQATDFGSQEPANANSNKPVNLKKLGRQYRRTNIYNCYVVNPSKQAKNYSKNSKLTGQKTTKYKPRRKTKNMHSSARGLAKTRLGQYSIVDKFFYNGNKEEKYYKMRDSQRYQTKKERLRKRKLLVNSLPLPQHSPLYMRKSIFRKDPNKPDDSHEYERGMWAGDEAYPNTEIDRERAGGGSLGSEGIINPNGFGGE